MYVLQLPPHTPGARIHWYLGRTTEGRYLWTPWIDHAIRYQRQHPAEKKAADLARKLGRYVAVIDLETGGAVDPTTGQVHEPHPE